MQDPPKHPTTGPTSLLFGYGTSEQPSKVSIRGHVLKKSLFSIPSPTPSSYLHSYLLVSRATSMVESPRSMGAVDQELTQDQEIRSVGPRCGSCGHIDVTLMVFLDCIFTSYMKDAQYFRWIWNDFCNID